MSKLRILTFLALSTLIAALILNGSVQESQAQGPGSLLYDRFGVELELQGPYNDGSTQGDDNAYVWDSFVPTNNTATVEFTESDWYGNWDDVNFDGEGVTIQHPPAPGTADNDWWPSGNEPYDVEAIYFDNDIDNLYIAIVTSTPLYVESSGGGASSGVLETRISGAIIEIIGGDLALDLGVSTPRDEEGSREFRYDYGIDLVDDNRSNFTAQQGNYLSAEVRNYGVGSSLYKTGFDLNPGGGDVDPWPSGDPQNSDWYVAQDTGRLTNLSNHTNFDPQNPGNAGTLEYRGETIVNFYEYQFAGGQRENNSSTYVIEATIPRALFGNDNPGHGDKVGISWVMGCRNDGNSDSDPIIRLEGTVDDPVEVGDLVFDDVNDNGVYDGSDVGIDGVDVELYDLGPDGAPRSGDETLVASTTTATLNSAPGRFLFNASNVPPGPNGEIGLPPGDYYVCVPPGEFGGGGQLNGYLSSTITESDPDDDENEVGGATPGSGAVNPPGAVSGPGDENGLNDAVPATNGVCSGVVTLAPSTEPTSVDDVAVIGAEPDSSSNLTVDFGFTQEAQVPVELGDLVFDDVNDNGFFDAGDSGIDGVDVQLYRPGDVPFVTPPLATTTTAQMGAGSSPGRYLFSGLAAGVYFACVPPSEFQGGGPLNGLLSSSITESDPDDDENEDGSAAPGSGSIGFPGSVTGPGDENGLNNTNPATNGICSGEISLLASSEPTTEDVAGIGTQPDADSNLTLDFGFTAESQDPVEVGDLVFFDANSNGYFDGSDSGINGVKVDLYHPGSTPGSTPPIASAVTASLNSSPGRFLFSNLSPGVYFMCVARSNFGTGQPLENYLSSSPTELDPDDDENEDNAGSGGPGSVSGPGDENGIDDPVPSSNGICTGDFTLVATTEPTGEDVAGIDTQPDANSNLTMDFGFVDQVMSLGDIVFADANNNGYLDGAETGIDNVTVDLYRSTDPIGSPFLSTTTGGGLPSGRFLFSGLKPDEYFLCIPPSEFGGVLAGYSSSGPTEVNPNDDDNDDGTGSGGPGAVNGPGDENGLNDPNPAANGICTDIVTLAPGAEPTGDDVDGIDPGTPDANSNLSVDFGVVDAAAELVEVGDLVWNDANNNGNYDGGESCDFDGSGTVDAADAVTVELYQAGKVAGVDTPYDTTVTNGQCRYLFTNLPPGDYFAHLPVSNFNCPGCILYGYASTIPTGTDPNNDINDDESCTTGGEGDENGLNDTDQTTQGVSTGEISLGIGAEPTGECGGSATLPDNDSNLTLDFGLFESVAIGNIVWGDVDNNGKFDLTESGLANVPVELYQSGDTPGVTVPFATDTTDGSGFFLFMGLPPGDYFVAVNAGPGGSNLPAGYTSSSSGGDHPPDATGDHPLDDGDDGVPGANNRVVTQVFTANPRSQPDTGDTGDPPGFPDDSAYMTVDFGFQYQEVVDWGDLPDSFATDASDGGEGVGPSHRITSDLYLGACVDAEADGQPDDTPNPQAGAGGAGTGDGDDGNGSNPPAAGTCDDEGDDEDGITLTTPLIPDEEVCFEIAFNNTTGSDVTLYHWIDWNGDGDFSNGAIVDDDEAGEISLPNGTISPYTQCFTVPAAATFDGGETHMRFRLTTDMLTATDWGGEATDGEVEDYWQPLACIGNYIWDDSTGSTPNVQDGSDTALEGVSVRMVWADGNGTIDTAATDATAQGDDAIYTTTTDVDGRYSFCGLTPDTYRVQIPTPPVDTNEAVTPGMGTNTTDSDGTQSGGPGTPVEGPDFTIPDPPTTLPTGEDGNADNPGGLNNFPDGQDDLTIDFGFTENSKVAIGNIVWLDSGAGGNSNNGKKDGDEGGIDGVIVELYQDTNGNDVCEPGPGSGTDGAALASTTTAGNGIYQFLNFDPSTGATSNYCVAISKSDPFLIAAGVGASSTGGNQNPDIGDHDVDLGDDGVPSGAYVISQPFAATVGGQTTTDTGNPPGYDDASAYMTVDFGFLSGSATAVNLLGLKVQTVSSWLLPVLLVLAAALLSLALFFVRRREINSV